MAIITADRVKQSVVVTGIAAPSLSGGAVAGFQLFGSVMSIGDNCYYAMVDNIAGVWEVGFGTYLSGNSLQRTLILAGSNYPNPTVFPGNVCDVYNDFPAALLNGAPFLSLQGGNASGPISINGANVLTTVTRTLEFSILGIPPASQVYQLVITEPGTLLANAAGAKAHAINNPGSNWLWPLATVHNGTLTTQGTMTLSSSGSLTLPTYADVPLVAGDTVQLTAPGAPDVSGGNVVFGIRYRTPS